MLRSTSTRKSGSWSLGLARAIVSMPLLVTLACHPYTPAVVGESAGSDAWLTTNGAPHPVSFIRMHDTLTVQRVFKIHGRVGESRPDLMRMRVDFASAVDEDGKVEVSQPLVVGSIALIPVMNGNPVGFSLERSRASDVAAGVFIGVLAIAAVVVAFAYTYTVNFGRPCGMGHPCK